MTLATASAARPFTRQQVAGLIMGAIGLILLSVFFGVVDLPAAEIMAVLTGHGSDQGNLIIATIRIPRIATGILAGMHFAVAGVLLQSITRNPLADPTIMGISQGATLAVTVFLFFAVYRLNSDSNTLYALPVGWLPLVGCGGGLFGGALIYVLALGKGLSALRLTLCGIAIGAFLHAIAMGIVVGWGSARIEIVMQWLAGSLYARGWEHVLFLLPFTIAGFLALPFVVRPLAMLRFEEDAARSFGLSYRLWFSLVLAIASVLAASAVGAVGPLIFVGLVVPHLARFVAGRHFHFVLPLAALIGASLVTAADLAGRLIGGPEEIPIGVVTAFAGAPILLILLRRHQ
ncbi:MULTISPECIES: iron ABC transporter permease [Sinorhizobium]|uniref:FecCD family ABC transporter permease n=1 Tax=Sinorhizobium TaxID=28105 RepID=UPI000BE7DC0D|nr:MULTISPECIES: iron ABC transporter permease [Sinorhizobium]PDT55003.1 ferrichrome ABC transporter permease [Sinorhizobium sp. NG07B]POH32046.1 ferrichrome ABC transporter permease [Sinorhizobium americanum]